MGEFNKAIDDYSRALEYKDEDSFHKPELLEKRGKCYEASKGNQKAQADFDAAAELKKRSVNT
ncbi:MAG: hypothetical protein LBQ61_00205 [Spirochaetales bacterium]|jgi:tetratricopeptide (TPR) repeat protein|nr:hypothetical protein [Spirochaetales bacterium]